MIEFICSAYQSERRQSIVLGLDFAALQGFEAQ
jgi:hypothetical protein